MTEFGQAAGSVASRRSQDNTTPDSDALRANTKKLSRMVNSRIMTTDELPSSGTGCTYSKAFTRAPQAPSRWLGSKSRNTHIQNNKKVGTANSRPSETSQGKEEVTNGLQKQRDIKDRRLCPLLAETLKGCDGSLQGMCVKRNTEYVVSIADRQKAWPNTIRSATSSIAGPEEGTSRFPPRTQDLYDLLLPYVLTPQELFRCGYPRLCPKNPGRVVCVEGEAIYSSRKTCSRCRASFVITRSGDYYANNACFFHTGRCSAIGFSCCGAPADHPGCNSSYYHICPFGARDKWETAALAFVRTRRRNGGTREVFALDCEMCFTIRGFEVARVSVVDCFGTTVYDSYVKPGSSVLDYSTPFSGITAEHLRNVRTTLQDVQAVLFRLLNASTMLIGHGLENDLRALRLIHDTVVDTSIVFPHYRGLPYRRSLRSLVAAYLNRGVPNGPLGHDSVEDAKACMELMLWKAARDQEMRNRLRGGAGGYPTQPSQLDDDVHKCSFSDGGVKAESFEALEEPDKESMPLGSHRELPIE
ncbi:putative exonuclease GOR [Haemaphysalis longicornis]